MQPPLPPRPMPAQAGPQDPYSRYDEPTGVFGGAQDGPRGDFDGPGGMRGPAGPGRPGLPGRPGGAPVPPGAGPRGPEGYDPEERFNGFEPGRHGKMDMTAEIRLPDRDPRGGGRGPAGPPAIAGPPMGGPPMGGPGLGVPAVGGPGGDLHRVDQIRRTFQVRRFGSGYDPDQVDRMFDEILSSMAGRGPMPVTPADLDAPRFGLVPGGYFEAEVDAALKEVKDIIFRR